MQDNIPDIPGYRIEKELGRGGMATVYLALQESLSRRVALKVMRVTLLTDQDYAERFVREARTVGSLQHPSIVAIHDAGKVANLSYIAMEYVAGGDLKDKLYPNLLDPGVAVSVIRQIADALHYAHDRGFVHRDVKPENILFRVDGTAVLSDFGIARTIGSQTRMTGAGMSIGTPHYMSPEQARGQEVDGRSDLYSLGVVFYEMLTGQVPFDAQESFAIGLMHINDRVPVLPDQVKHYQTIVDRLLAKERNDRYQNGADLIKDLEHIDRGEIIRPFNPVTRLINSQDRAVSSVQRKLFEGIKPIEIRHRFGSMKKKHWGVVGAVFAVIVSFSFYLTQDRKDISLSYGSGGASSLGDMMPEGRSSDEVAIDPVPSLLRELLDQDDEFVSHKGVPDSAPMLQGDAILYLTSNPDGAEVFLDEQFIGHTPFQSDGLPPGDHRLRLMHRYYEPWERTISLEDNVVNRLQAHLQRGSGRLTVITDPPGAEVWIEGQPLSGTTPLTIGGLRASEHSIELRLDRHRTKSYVVEVLPSDTARLDAVMEDGDLYEWAGRWLTADEVIPLLLEAAEADFNASRLMQPEGNSAWDKYQQVLSMRPNDPAALRGIEQIGNRYLELADSALKSDQLDRAEMFLHNAQVTEIENSRLVELDTRLQEARLVEERRLQEARENARLAEERRLQEARENARLAEERMNERIRVIRTNP